jgi:hypothetical protein
MSKALGFRYNNCIHLVVKGGEIVELPEHLLKELIKTFGEPALAEREAQVVEREREAAKGLAEALDNILYMHDGNQSPAMNMPDVDYARFIIRKIHNESRAALATYNDNRKAV